MKSSVGYYGASRDDLNEERVGIRGDWDRFKGNKTRTDFIRSQGTSALAKRGAWFPNRIHCWQVSVGPPSQSIDCGRSGGPGLEYDD